MALVSRALIRTLREKHASESWDFARPLLSEAIGTRVMESASSEIIRDLPIPEEAKAGAYPLFSPIQRASIEVIHAKAVASEIELATAACRSPPVFKPRSFDNVVETFMLTGTLLNKMSALRLPKNGSNGSTGDGIKIAARKIKVGLIPVVPSLVIDGHSALCSASFGYLKLLIGDGYYSVFVSRYEQASLFFKEMEGQEG